MRKTLLSVLVAVAIPATALAQVGDPPAQPDPTVEPVPEPVIDEPEPEPVPEPVTEPDPVESPKASNGAETADDGVNRPAGFTLGFGFGWDFPADLQIPDTTSVRIRLPSGLIIEPALELSRLSENDEVGAADNTDNTGVLALAASVRFPLLSSNRMDLVGVGGGLLAFTAIDPDGGNNDTTLSTVSLFYGVGVDLWIRKHWALSFTTTNPLFVFDKTSTDDGAGGDTTSTDTFFGLVFDPNVLVMVHLFFD